MATAIKKLVAIGLVMLLHISIVISMTMWKINLYAGEETWDTEITSML